MLKRSVLTLASPALALTLAASAQAAIVIDDFTTPVGETTVTLPKNAITTGVVPVGPRALVVTQTTDGGISASITVTVGQQGPLGLLDYSSANRDGAVAVGYETVPAGIDVLAGIYIDFEYFDPGTPSEPLTITLVAQFNVGDLQMTLPIAYTGDGSGTFFIPTPNFTGTGLRTLDVIFNAPRGSDFAISRIAAETDTTQIPEPSTAALVAPALALLSRRRRRA